ncbi:DinB family protein [Nocardioides taihuensis]|uniref:DinB family protein n=1 Tax=Nocardioides taihuensis TaxID=1835606 RepID=A0ABW0BFN6_9ACTN
MTRFGPSDELAGAEFYGADLRGARFAESDLSGVVMRGVEVSGFDVDAPWLRHGDGFLVNGVDVTAYVEAELDRRFPGRDQRQAETPEALREAWAALERAWQPVLERAADLPPGAVDESVAGEYSFAQTLRHLVLATDAWLGKAVLRREQPFHPLGLSGAGGEEWGPDPSLFTTGAPTYDEVLAARAERVAMVRDFLATATPQELATERRGPWDTDREETTLRCLHVILEEEWEHLRFAVRDLDVVAARG